MRNALLMLGAAAAVGVVTVFGVGAGDVEAEQSATAPVQLAQNNATAAEEGQAAKEGQEAAEATAAEPEKTLEEKGYALGDLALGDPNAPVTMIEYLSLTCPHCAHFNNDTLPALKAKYIDTGKVKLIVREVYFDQFGLWATAVARCGGEMRYHAFIDTFFQTQKDWARGDNQEDIVNKIRAIGRKGGLSPQRVDACLSDEAYVTKLVETYQEHAKRDEVTSTPFFLINGEVVRGARSPEEMSAVIDSKLAD